MEPRLGASETHSINPACGNTVSGYSNQMDRERPQFEGHIHLGMKGNYFISSDFEFSPTTPPITHQQQVDDTKKLRCN